jgi:hypothetical protein
MTDVQSGRRRGCDARTGKREKGTLFGKPANDLEGAQSTAPPPLFSAPPRAPQ